MNKAAGGYDIIHALEGFVDKRIKALKEKIGRHGGCGEINSMLCVSRRGNSNV